jgi:hypothetical protein
MISSGLASINIKRSGCNCSKTQIGKPGKKPDGVLMVQWVSTITLSFSDLLFISLAASA